MSINQLKKEQIINDAIEIISPFLEKNTNGSSATVRTNLLEISKKQSYKQSDYFLQESPIDEIDTLNSHLIWLHTRENPQYISHYKRMHKFYDLNRNQENELLFKKDFAFRFKWSILYVRAPEEFRFNNKILFLRQSVWDLNALHKFTPSDLKDFLLSHIESKTLHRGHGKTSLSLLIRPGPPEVILAQLKAIITDEKTGWKNYFNKNRLHTKSHSNLVENICANFLVKNGFRGKALEVAFAKVMATNTKHRSDNILKMSKTFESLAKLSPDCFLYGFKNSH